MFSKKDRSRFSRTLYNPYKSGYISTTLSSICSPIAWETIDWLPSSNLVIHTQKYFFIDSSEFEFVLRAERKDNFGGKTMFGLFLLVSVTIIKHPF